MRAWLNMLGNAWKLTERRTKMNVVTATELPRLMNCEGSLFMVPSYPPTSGDDKTRNEGNAVHWLVQQVFGGHFTADELIDRKSPEGVYITAEMVEYVEQYLLFVTTPASFNVIEHDTSHGEQTWQINGRADSVKYDSLTADLHISDLKFGWSIVEPEMNWTLISHAIWFLKNNPNSIIRNIHFSIFQPRPYHHLGNVRTWTITGHDLLQLALRVQTTMSNPSNVLKTGDHCHNCPALATCPAARKALMNAVEASETAFNDKIDNINLSFQLDHLKRVHAIVKDMEKAYKELAIFRLREGEVVQNYSLEQGLTNRQWLPHATPEFVEALTGKHLTKKELVTPAQAEKLGVPKEIVNILAKRHNTSVDIVRIDANTKAQKLFKTKER